MSPKVIRQVRRRTEAVTLQQSLTAKLRTLGRTWYYRSSPRGTDNTVTNVSIALVIAVVERLTPKCHEDRCALGTSPEVTEERV